MIVFDHLSAPPRHGSDQRLYGLSGVGIVLGGLQVVLELELSPKTPPAESCKDRSSSHQPHPLLFLFLSLYSSPISIFPFFLASAALLSAPSSSFPSSLQRLLSWFRRRMPCLFFFCILSVMNISLSCL